MSYRIKGWVKFQHFKDRRPPWIKLYRDLLEDPDWHDLDGDTAKVLIALWLLASEDEDQKGLLPDVRRMAFRLRISETKINQALAKLSHWLEHDDINVISTRYQHDAPETETETETYTPSRGSGEVSKKSLNGFDAFWKLYPRKVGKATAEKSWIKARINGDFDRVMTSLAEQIKNWDDPKFIPHASTWLNGRRWEDELSTRPEVRDWI